MKFVVGGWVRDELLGFQPKDRDWVWVGTTAKQLERRGFQQVGKDFPVFIDPKTGEEHALARTERKSGRGHTGFTVDASPEVTLEEDLSRRDLTINAIAKGRDGKYIDPFGGMEDLQLGIIRHVSDAFADDPLRVLRAARFAARFGFTVAPTTMDMMRKISASGELEELPAERVVGELEKVFDLPGASTFFRVLEDCGALWHLFPELQQLIGVPQPVDHHPEGCAWEHTMLCLDHADVSNLSPQIKFAVLTHDLGKGVTPRGEWPKHIGHEKTGVPVFEGMADRLRIRKSWREFGVRTVRWHMHFHRLPEMKPGKVIDLLGQFRFRHGTEELSAFAHACMCDQNGRGGVSSLVGMKERNYLMACAEAARAVKFRTHDRDGNKYSRDVFLSVMKQDLSDAIRQIKME